MVFPMIVGYNLESNLLHNHHSKICMSVSSIKVLTAFQTFNWVFEYQPIASYILINTAKLLHKSRTQFSSRQKRSSQLGPDSCLVYTFIFSNLLIHDFACFDVWLYIMKKKKNIILDGSF